MHGADGPLAGAAAQPRRLAVLAVIARSGTRGVTRAKLLTLLWPDAEEVQGRRVITQALYALRRDLGIDEAIGGTKDLRLSPEHVACDIVEFEAALDQGDREGAYVLYAGPYLHGFRLLGAPEFERWVDDTRAALQHRLHDAVEHLARSSAVDGAHDRAAAWWRRRAADDPLSARIAVQVMRALTAGGDRAGALRHARVFQALSAEELGLPPDREVIALAESLAEPADDAVTLVSPASAGDHIGAIAVLPFAHLGLESDDDHQRRWRDGLAEEMIGELSRVLPNQVLARTASFALGAAPGLTALRAESAITHAIEGSVRRSASGIRVTARLLHVRSGQSVWSERFECDLADGTSAHDDIAARVAERVRQSVRARAS